MSELTGIVSFRGNAYLPLGTGDAVAADSVRRTLEANGWSVNHVEVNSGWFSNTADVIVNIVYVCSLSQSVDSIQSAINNAINGGGYLSSADLRFNGWLESCSPTSTTQPVTPVTGTVTIHTGGGNQQVPIISGMVNGFTKKGTYGAYDIYSDNANPADCYLLNGSDLEFWGDCSGLGGGIVSGGSTPNDFLTQIGKALGFGKNTAQAAGGITAATGGAIVILAALFFLSRK